MELQGTHRRDRLEMSVEPHDTHAQVLGKLLNAKQLIEVLEMAGV